MIRNLFVKACRGAGEQRSGEKESRRSREARGERVDRQLVFFSPASLLKSSPASLLGLAISLLAAIPSYADNAIRSVRTIPQNKVTGAEAELPTVQVWQGQGVSISFFETRETIKRVWLDDPSRVVMDVDGCLEGLSNKECKNPGAGLIHLRQIEPIRIQGLPVAINGTLLTVVTETLGGGRKTYNFKVVMGNGEPTYSTVQIIPDITKTLAPPSDSIAIATINKGIQVAAESRWITPTNPLWGKLQKLVLELEAGKNLTTAAQSVGVSQRLVERLLELGSQPQKSNLLREQITPPPKETAQSTNSQH